MFKQGFIMTWLAAALCAAAPALAQDSSSSNRIDTIRSDAPALAAYGNHTIGVKTYNRKNSGQLDGYLQLVEIARDGKWSAEKNGNFKADPTYLKGFPARSAVGLTLKYRKP